MLSLSHINSCQVSRVCGSHKGSSCHGVSYSNTSKYDLVRYGSSAARPRAAIEIGGGLHTTGVARFGHKRSESRRLRTRGTTGCRRWFITPSAAYLGHGTLNRVNLVSVFHEAVLDIGMDLRKRETSEYLGARLLWYVPGIFPHP